MERIVKANRYFFAFLMGLVVMHCTHKLIAEDAANIVPAAVPKYYTVTVYELYDSLGPVLQNIKMSESYLTSVYSIENYQIKFHNGGYAVVIAKGYLGKVHPLGAVIK